MMEIVVDYIPGHYMALYHAGMAEYMLGQRDLAKKNLTEFLRYYPPKDGWRTNAEDVLTRLNNPAAMAVESSFISASTRATSSGWSTYGSPEARSCPL